MTTLRVRGFLAMFAAACLAGCGSFGGGLFGGAPAGSRTLEAPVARVKPAVVSTLASMGMMITSLESRGTTETIHAKKGSSGVQVELESLGRTTTRVRVGADGRLDYDDAAGAKILEQTARVVSGG
jgi:hypothetical protein